MFPEPVRIATQLNSPVSAFSPFGTTSMWMAPSVRVNAQWGSVTTR